MKRWPALAVIAALLAGCALGSKPLPPEPSPAAPFEPPAAAHAAPPPPPKPPEPPRASIAPQQVLQGDVAVLRMDRPVAGSVSVKVEGLNEQPRVFLMNGRAVAFIGFPANARMGAYPVSVSWEGGQWAGAVEVVRKVFTEDRLVVTAEQEAVYYDPRQAQDWARVFALRSKSDPAPLWDGAFQLPVAGELKITTYFGEIRFVNGVETGRHSGMDFGAPEGTPILAPARGRVVMAEKLIVTGLTIIIDHGMNLYTTYYHCSAMDVEPGQWVEPGDLIGKVGTTGFSLGAHLHWTATIGNTPVDPWPLTEAPPLGFRKPGPVAPD